MKLKLTATAAAIALTFSLSATAADLVTFSAGEAAVAADATTAAAAATANAAATVESVTTLGGYVDTALADALQAKTDAANAATEAASVANQVNTNKNNIKSTTTNLAATTDGLTTVEGTLTELIVALASGEVSDELKMTIPELAVTYKVTDSADVYFGDVAIRDAATGTYTLMILDGGVNDQLGFRTALKEIKVGSDGSTFQDVMAHTIEANILPSVTYYKTADCSSAMFIPDSTITTPDGWYLLDPKEIKAPLANLNIDGNYYSDARILTHMSADYTTGYSIKSPWPKDVSYAWNDDDFLAIATDGVCEAREIDEATGKPVLFTRAMKLYELVEEDITALPITGKTFFSGATYSNQTVPVLDETQVTLPFIFAAK